MIGEICISCTSQPFYFVQGIFSFCNISVYLFLLTETVRIDILNVIFHYSFCDSSSFKNCSPVNYLDYFNKRTIIYSFKYF